MAKLLKSMDGTADRSSSKARPLHWLILALVPGIALSASPCPPTVSMDGVPPSSDSVACAVQSDTPDYADPMATCTGLQSRRVVSVASSTALQNALTNASCGDTIQLAAGSYGASLTLDKSCPATSPIIVQGAPNFGSLLTQKFTVGGARNVIAGIQFAGPSSGVRLGGTNNKILANRFTDWRGYAITPTTGEQGEVAYNEIYKPHPWLESEVGTYPYRAGIRTNEKGASSFHFRAWVHRNHFRDFPTKPDPDSYHSGQSDAIELCETNRTWTYSSPSGWYIERNLIRNHLQGHGIVDLKCSGVVVRYNTVIDSPGGRIDVRYGTGSILESNWQENSGGSMVHGGHHRAVGNYMRGGSGLQLMSGDIEWNYGTGTGYPRAYKVLAAGNDTNALVVGRAFTATTEAYPALDSVIEAHKGSEPSLRSQQNTVVRASTDVRFGPPFKLQTSDVGPAAMANASPAYLRCRRP